MELSTAATVAPSANERYAPRIVKVSLCLLTFDELPGCEIDVPQIDRDAFDEVFAVDGGSADGTGEYLESQGIPVHLQKKRGLNQAYIEAAQIAQGDAVVVFFPKGTVSPAILPRMRELLEEGNELVIPSRNLPDGINEEDSQWLRPRKWAATCLSWFIHVAWNRHGPRITDVLHGIKGFRKDAFERIGLSELKVTVDLECAVRAYRLGLRYVEFPVEEKARFYGETHFKALACGKEYIRFFRYETSQRGRSDLLAPIVIP